MLCLGDDCPAATGLPLPQPWELSGEPKPEDVSAAPARAEPSQLSVEQPAVVAVTPVTEDNPLVPEDPAALSPSADEPALVTRPVVANVANAPEVPTDRCGHQPLQSCWWTPSPWLLLLHWAPTPP